MGQNQITQQVSERYARAAATGEQMCCPTGYDMADLRRFIPEEVLKISYGCGTPAGLTTVRPGETVLDIGSGGGIDCFEAARRVGAAGHVIGLDMTDTMLEIARRNAPLVAANLGFPASNVEFRKGLAGAMPVDGDSIDLIISNCVINLAPDKRQVFGEMFRVLKPGGRFTISDIVADQPLPNYLIHDVEKWGNCLSGALQAGDYIGGLAEAGFLGIHRMKSAAWTSIDGIHFLSITLTGYKLPDAGPETASHFATLRGPFSRAIDETGHAYRRGLPEPIGTQQAQLLRTSPLADLFLLSDRPASLEPSDPRWAAVLPEPAPCVWAGDYAIFAGPFLEAEDDDHHTYRRGVPLEICSKTLKVLQADGYRPHFMLLNRAAGSVTGTEVSCDPGGSCC